MVRAPRRVPYRAAIFKSPASASSADRRGFILKTYFRGTNLEKRDRSLMLDVKQSERWQSCSSKTWKQFSLAQNVPSVTSCKTVHLNKKSKKSTKVISNTMGSRSLPSIKKKVIKGNSEIFTWSRDTGFYPRTWCLHYPQCNLATVWHLWRHFYQITRSFLWSHRRLNMTFKNSCKDTLKQNSRQNATEAFFVNVCESNLRVKA